MKYDFAAIEKKWQDKWEQVKPYAAVTGDPYPVRAYISMRHNILSSLPDPDTLRSKLDKLDLIVAITTTWSPTLMFFTSLPTATMTPAFSWPGTRGNTALGFSPRN